MYWLGNLGRKKGQGQLCERKMGPLKKGNTKKGRKGKSVGRNRRCRGNWMKNLPRGSNTGRLGKIKANARERVMKQREKRGVS